MLAHSHDVLLSILPVLQIQMIERSQTGLNRSPLKSLGPRPPTQLHAQGQWTGTLGPRPPPPPLE